MKNLLKISMVTMRKRGEWKIQFINHFAVDLLSISELTVIPVIMKFIVNGEIMLL